MKQIDEQIPQLVSVFSHLLQAQTENTAKENYNAYFMLVDQLETLTASALNEKETANVRKVKKIIRRYVKHISKQVFKPTDFHEVEQKKQTLKDFDYLRDVIVSYPLKKLIAKIYISALSRTIMREIIPRDAGNFDFESDLQDALEEIAFNLESLGYEPLNGWAE